MDLTGKTAFVTGGSGDIGGAIARALAAAGADVVISYVGHPEGAAATVDAVRAAGRRSLAVQLDQREPASIDASVASVTAHFGRLDILVNNAGTIRRTPAIDFSEKDWDEVMAINAKTVFFLSQAVARDMMKRKQGKIINIASLLSFSGGINVPSYSASKGAVAQVTKALANEWAQFGLNINAIAPGYMITNNTANLRKDPERTRAISERIPMGRWGTPEDLRGAAIFLASKASDYINGHVLVVDGGWMAR